MAESHVISGLVKKRAELSGDLEHLRQQMIQIKGEIGVIDCAIHLFDAEYKVKDIKAIRKKATNKFFESGERSRAILDLFRDSDGEALSVEDIATAISTQHGMELQDKGFKKLVATLHDGMRNLLNKGVVDVASRANGTPCYVLIGRSARPYGG